MEINASILTPETISRYEPYTSNLDMLIEIRRDLERAITSYPVPDAPPKFDTSPAPTDSDVWMTFMSLVENRLKQSDPETIPLAALVLRYRPSQIETTILLILFFSAVNTDFRRLFDPDTLPPQNSDTRIWMSFRAIIEKTRLGHLIDEESLLAQVSESSSLLSNHLIDISYSLEKADPRHDPDIAISQDMLHIIKGIMPNQEDLFQVEHPTTQLCQVVLPQDTKKKLLTLIGNYNEIQRCRTRMELDETLEYGHAAVILFYGKSGTGKTLMARAISNYTGRPLIAPRLNTFGRNGYDSQQTKDAIERIFFETERRNGILFLDECEEYLSENSLEMQLFLRAFEKARCIVILSTNVPEVIYASFDRRISLKIEFESPDAWQRLEIWKTLIPPRIKLSSDVNLSALSKLFPFTGGIIKNALLYALNLAIHRNPIDPELTWADLEEACRGQESHFGRAASWRILLKSPWRLHGIHLSADDIARGQSISDRIKRLDSFISLNKVTVSGVLAGAKILVQSASEERASRIAMAIASEVSDIICSINTAEVLIRGNLGDDPGSVAAMLSTVITSNAASAKQIVIRDADLVLGNFEETGNTLSNRQIRDMLLNHPASMIFVTSNEFRLPVTCASFFCEIFRETGDSPEHRLAVWKNLFDEYSLAWPLDCDETLILNYKLEPDEMRRVILQSVWERIVDGEVPSIPFQTLHRIVERFQKGKKIPGFDMRG